MKIFLLNFIIIIILLTGMDWWVARELRALRRKGNCSPLTMLLEKHSITAQPLRQVACASPVPWALGMACI